MRCISPVLALTTIVLGVSLAAAQQPTRYVGRLANGQIITGTAVADWHAPEAAPRLDNQPLLDPQNSFRWLRDRSLRLADRPDAFVETFTGDRLPGAVTAHVGPEPETFDGLPPHLVVQPHVELKAPRPYFSPDVRVVDDVVRRIVWRRRAIDRYEPGTAFFRDGRAVKFRSLRFASASAHLLLENGPTEAPFAELAELHFPQRDLWEAYFDELAALSPTSESRLFQVETTDGLVATASRERFFPLAEGGAGDVQRWLHGIQPAWSLDMLWVPHPNIVVRRSFAPHEVPLSRLLPTVEGAPSPLRGGGADFLINRSAEGASLESGSQEYGWGFGALGASRLRFSIPDLATGMEGRVGLDRAAGSGGAIQARILLDKAAAALWQSAPLVGTSQTTDWGRLQIPAAPAPRRDLILEIDPLAKNAPAGADPLDIRDLADWLDPLLILDQQKTQLEISRRTSRHVYAWSDWKVEAEAEKPVLWRHQFELNPGFNGTRLGVASPESPLRIVRRFNPAAADRWLVVAAEHPPGVPQRAKIEVRASGELAAEWEVPSYSPDPAQQQVLAVPLSRLKSGREVTLEILQTPTPKEAPVFWKEAVITDQAPMLYRLVEDDAQFAAVEGSSPDGLSWTSHSQRPGEKNVRVAGGGRFSLRLPREAAIRERPVLGEFRYVRFAYRKAGKGRVAVELQRTQKDLPPIRYDAGTGEPSYGSAARVWSLELPDQWIVATRDLFQDFGRADLVELTLGVPDGEYALFDHFYLARSERDFELIPAAASADETNREARRALAKTVLDRVVPATVAIDFGGRFSTGVLVSREGDVLTAGHAVISPGKDVTVLLSDGRRLPGKTKGVARDLDLGLVRLSEPGEWPIIELGDGRNLPKDQLYIGVAHKKTIETQAAPAAHVVGIDRALQGVISTDFDVDNWCSGGPLVDKDARLIGIHRGRSQFGGFLYTQLLDIGNVLPRLKNDEVWGVWPHGAGPMMGIHVETLADGCRVTEVYPDTPAVAAGIRVGDQIVKIDDKPVRRLEDIYDRLGSMDPGQQVALSLRRGAESAAATIPLIPRTP